MAVAADGFVSDLLFSTRHPLTRVQLSLLHGPMGSTLLPVVIPNELKPSAAQVPTWAVDRERYDLAFAIAVMICGRVDPVFISELYAGDLPTDDSTPDAASEVGTV